MAMPFPPNAPAVRVRVSLMLNAIMMYRESRFVGAVVHETYIEHPLRTRILDAARQCSDRFSFTWR